MSDNQQLQVRPPVPSQYAGQWIAWDHGRTRIIASGDSWDETWRAAKASGEEQPYLERVLDEGGFIG